METGRFAGKKTGIFGGSFDPPHIGHLVIAEKAREEYSLDRVVFVPAGYPPHKANHASGYDRLKMTEMAVSDNAFFQVTDIEVAGESISFSYDTVTKIEKRFPGDTMFMIIGEDSLHELHTWHRYRELSRKVLFLVAGRQMGRDDLEVPVGVEYRRIGSPLMEISSSRIREDLSAGLTVRYLVPREVIEYIRKENLYNGTQ